MRRVVIDPALIAAGIFGEPNCRRLLGLLAFGRWCQYIDLAGPAEEAKLQEEIEMYGGVRGGPSIDTLIERAQDRRAALVGRLPNGAPEDLLLAISPRLIDEVATQVQRAREYLPEAAADPELAMKARRLVTAIAGELVGTLDHATTGSLYDHLIAVAAEASAPIITDDPELARREGEVWQFTDPVSGRPAFAIQFWTFSDREVNRWPFALGDVPVELLEMSLREL